MQRWLLLLLEHLEQGSLINKISKTGRGTSLLQKPDKIVLENTNFSHALSQQPVEGTLRETFFVNQVRNKGYSVEVAEQGDFLVKGQYTFEVGGKNKKQKQIKEVENAYLVKDNINSGFGNGIPVWLFGFLY